jgi:hypothetical protein
MKHLLHSTIFSTIAGLAIAVPAFAANSNPASDQLYKMVGQGFNWAIGILAVLAAVSFAIGAIQYMFLQSQKDGKDRMLWSVVGLGLALTSVLFLNIVNPRIILPNGALNQLPSTGGLFLVKNDGSQVPIPDENSFDITPQISAYKSIYYDCKTDNFDPATTPRVILTLKDYSNSTKALISTTTWQVPCDSSWDMIPSTGTATGKVVITYEEAGAYFYTGNCNGTVSGPWNTTISNFADPLANNIACMIFFDGGDPSATNRNMMVIPSPVPSIVNNNSTYQAGQGCSNAYFSAQTGSRTKTSINCPNMRSALVFHVPDNPASDHNGVTFYSENNGQGDQRNGQIVGQVTIPQTAIGQSWVMDPSKIVFQYNDKTSAEAQKCPNFAVCPGSIYLNGGNYLIALRSVPNANSPTANPNAPFWVQYFTQDAPDVSATDAFNAQYPNFFRVTIVPIVQ